MREIKLWKNRHEISDVVTIVDDEDYERLIGITPKWYLWTSKSDSVYARTYVRLPGEKRHGSCMHRVIMNNPDGLDVDHINRNTLDNRKENLRVCTRAQNCQNKPARRDSATGYKGVWENKSPLRKRRVLKTGEVKYYEYTRKKRFAAYIAHPTKKNRNQKIGFFATAEEAARAYDAKAIERYGEYAYLNFPEEHNRKDSE